ncbi:hypothetical protein TNCV_3158691 [Trichonephila clavipes]|nr:hypothetical protein TNCV_3158691 [Trichonephila clavipes]
MDVCKCIAPLRHGGTLNSLRVTSPLVRFVEGEEEWEVPDHPTRMFSSKSNGFERDSNKYLLKANELQRTSASDGGYQLLQCNLDIRFLRRGSSDDANLLKVMSSIAQESMNTASSEITELNDIRRGMSQITEHLAMAPDNVQVH